MYTKNKSFTKLKEHKVDYKKNIFSAKSENPQNRTLIRNYLYNLEKKLIS